jgi:hypothetical protein
VRFDKEIEITEGKVRATRRDGGVLNAVFCDGFVLSGGRVKRLTTYLAEVTERPVGDSPA